VWEQYNGEVLALRLAESLERCRALLSWNGSILAAVDPDSGYGHAPKEWSRVVTGRPQLPSDLRLLRGRQRRRIGSASATGRAQAHAGGVEAVGGFLPEP
jgi:hypothetical protein